MIKQSVRSQWLREQKKEPFRESGGKPATFSHLMTENWWAAAQSSSVGRATCPSAQVVLAEGRCPVATVPGLAPMRGSRCSQSSRNGATRAARWGAKRGSHVSARVVGSNLEGRAPDEIERIAGVFRSKSRVPESAGSSGRLTRWARGRIRMPRLPRGTVGEVAIRGTVVNASEPSFPRGNRN